MSVVLFNQKTNECCEIKQNYPLNVVNILNVMKTPMVHF